MKNRQPPAQNSEAHVESEREILRRMEREFQQQNRHRPVF